MISYVCTINGTSTPIQIGATIGLDGTEKFDTGQIIVKHSTRSAEYTEADDVVITIGSTAFNFIIQADKVERLTSTLYDHTITLTEETAKLSKSYSVDRFFTINPSGNVLWSLYQILNTVRVTTPLDKTQLYTIAAATQTALAAESPQKKFEGLNQFQIAVDVMRGIKAVPRLSSGVLSHTLYNALNNPIALSSLTGWQKDVDYNNYATTIVSKAKNMTYDADLATGGTWFPSDNGWATPRSSSGKYSDDNAEFQIGFPIRRVLSVTWVGATYDDGGPQTANIDISQWVVSKDEWDGLIIGSTTLSTLVTQIAQRNTIYYDIGGTTIKGMGNTFKSSLILTHDTMEMIKKSWLADNGYNITTNYSSQDIRDVGIRVFYQPYFDADISAEKWDTAVTKRSEILSNQKDTILDMGRYGGVLSDIAQRMANGNWLVKQKHADITDAFELNDYTSDGYKIIKAQHSLYPEHISSTYELSKNWITLDGYQTVYRSTDPYTIGRDNVNANFRYTEYLEFSTTSRTTTGNLSAQGFQTLLNAYQYASADNLPVYGAQFYSSDSNQSTQAINMQAISIGSNGIRFVTGFTHPKNAGNTIEDDTTGGVDLGSIISAIRYTAEDGFMTSATIDFISTLALTSAEAIAMADDYPLSAYVDAADVIFTVDASFYLNQNELLGINAELLPSTDEPDAIVVGKYFSILNNLVKPIGSAPTIKCYVSAATTKYTVFDTIIKESTANSTSYTVSKASRYIDVSGITNTDTRTWAIGYDDGTTEHLLFAVNYDGTTRQRIYINNLKERSTTEAL